MNMKTIITSPTRCFYDVSILLAIVAMAGNLLEPMEIRIDGNLQHNRNN